MLCIFTLFGIDTARDGIRCREKWISEEERSPHIMKSSTGISEGGRQKKFLCMPDFLPLSSFSFQFTSMQSLK